MGKNEINLTPESGKAKRVVAGIAVAAIVGTGTMGVIAAGKGLVEHFNGGSDIGAGSVVGGAGSNCEGMTEENGTAKEDVVLKEASKEFADLFNDDGYMVTDMNNTTDSNNYEVAFEGTDWAVNDLDGDFSGWFIFNTDAQGCTCNASLELENSRLDTASGEEVYDFIYILEDYNFDANNCNVYYAPSLEQANNYKMKMEGGDDITVADEYKNWQPKEYEIGDGDKSQIYTVKLPSKECDDYMTLISNVDYEFGQRIREKSIAGDYVYDSCFDIDGKTYRVISNNLYNEEVVVDCILGRVEVIPENCEDEATDRGHTYNGFIPMEEFEEKCVLDVNYLKPDDTAAYGIKDTSFLSAAYDSDEHYYYGVNECINYYSKEYPSQVMYVEFCGAVENLDEVSTAKPYKTYESNYDDSFVLLKDIDVNNISQYYCNGIYTESTNKVILIKISEENPVYVLIDNEGMEDETILKEFIEYLKANN